MEKNQLRQQLREQRRALSSAEIERYSAAVCERLRDRCRGKRCVMAYLSAFHEVCVDDAIRELLKSGGTVAVPVTDAETGKITPYALRDLNAVHRGAYGIREPIKTEEISKEQIEAVLVPGVGFDRSGGRLGFGKGCYDRFLADFSGLRIGICYEFQLVEKIETEERDVPMDMIITEKNCYVI